MQDIVFEDKEASSVRLAYAELFDQWNNLLVIFLGNTMTKEENHLLSLNTLDEV